MRRNVPHDESEREFTREGGRRQLVRRGKDTSPAACSRSSRASTGRRAALGICHMISNVQVLRASSDGPARARSPSRAASSSIATRRDETDVLVGKREDLLRRVNGTFKIARRKIILDQSVLLAKNLTFFF